MALPVLSFAGLAAGNQPLSLFDQQFTAVANGMTISCTASGSNTLVLTPNPNNYVPTTYTNGAPRFVWVQPIASALGPITINVAGLGPVTAYRANGATALGALAAGELIAGCVYTATYSSALSSGSGGFAVDVVPATGAQGPAGPTGPTGPQGPAGPAGGAVIISDTAPASPTVGEFWCDSVATLLYLYYNDGNSSQWVNVNNAPNATVLADAPTDGSTYGRQTSSWQKVMPLTGGGTVTGGPININGPPGTVRQLGFETATNNRWTITAGSAAETGSNIGSDLIVSRYSDAGTLIDTPFSIIRQTGNHQVGGQGIFYTSYGATHYIAFSWGGPPMTVFVDNVNVGTLTPTCDYRTKKNIFNLPTMWECVKKLRPVKFTQADAFDGLFVADDVERWGFLAHELQETLTTDAATGDKDAEKIVQSPNLLAVIAALTKALQEAIGRIEALEATHV